MEIELEGVCYVLIQTNQIHPIAYRRHDLIWYPERKMTLLDTIQYKPYVQSIVTENPWLISCYSKENVRIWSSEYKEWAYPAVQTYGASICVIMDDIIGIYQSIPSIALDGGKQIQEMISKLDYKGE